MQFYKKKYEEFFVFIVRVDMGYFNIQINFALITS